MIIDARNGTPDTPIECDLCIVGAGAAGLTVALELAESGFSICVLEAGGLRHDRVAQSMLAGETDNADYPPLHTVRAAGLGGTTRVWAGWGRPLDEIDLEARVDVPHSGWPFSHEELHRHYLRAHELLGLGPFDYDPSAWEKLSDTRRMQPAGGDFVNVLFRQCGSRFGVRHDALLRRSGRLNVWLHAHVMRLAFAPSGQAVTALEVATLNRRRFEVRPRTVVVAAGGIETPRLMLISAGAAAGPGNERGLVGRYFIDHGYHEGATYVPADPRKSLDFYFPRAIRTVDGRCSARGALTPAPATLRRHGLLNSAIYFRPVYEEHPAFRDDGVQAALELWDMLRSRAVPDRRLARAGLALGSPRALSIAAWRRMRHRGRPVPRLRLFTLFECAPNPENRVVLGVARDALDRPVARLQWRMSESDLLSVARTYRLLDEGLRRAGLGRLDVDGTDAGDGHRTVVAFGKHHLGTMRMHRDPARGVVNADGRVHGVDNLFVVGGSTFTTGGFANPTLTIVALASRLAGYLDRQLRGEGRPSGSSSGPDPSSR